MAEFDDYCPADLMCQTCKLTPWSQLPPEEYPAYKHHESRTALEASAKDCVMCKMLLEAAISANRNSKGSREGKSYWRKLLGVDYLENGTTRRVMYSFDLGANLSSMSSPPTGGVIAPTGKISGNGANESLPHDPADVLRMEDLSLNETAATDKVWLYGNWWKQSDDYRPGSEEGLNLMGIGVRFAKSGSIHDAPGCNQDTINLRGSPLRVCTSDGKIQCLPLDHDTKQLRSWHSQSNHPRSSARASVGLGRSIYSTADLAEHV
jgi:hypothetical protein